MIKGLLYILVTVFIRAISFIMMFYSFIKENLFLPLGLAGLITGGKLSGLFISKTYHKVKSD